MITAITWITHQQLFLQPEELEANFVCCRPILDSGSDDGIMSIINEMDKAAGAPAQPRKLGARTPSRQSVARPGSNSNSPAPVPTPLQSESVGSPAVHMYGFTVATSWLGQRTYTSVSHMTPCWSKIQRGICLD